MTIVHAETSAQLDAVRALWRSYWDELGFTPCFQGFEEEMAKLPGKYVRPDGLLLLCTIDERPAAAIAFRKYDTSACEAKRLYVATEFRGRGLARILMERLLEEARDAGYVRVLGDTMPVMENALAMYERMGFRRRPPYAGSTEGAIYIEYDIPPAATATGN